VAMAATEARRKGSRLDISWMVVLTILLFLEEGFVCGGLFVDGVLKSAGLRCAVQLG
jgi:hypothetical protein